MSQLVNKMSQLVNNLPVGGLCDCCCRVLVSLSENINALCNPEAHTQTVMATASSVD